ncbi:hypothetical protein [Sphingomonas aquatilis]
MATNAFSTPAPAQQPTLRSFIVCDRLPEGCVAYPVTDETNAPHLRPGDIAIIDPTDRDVCVGELFVAQWGSGKTDIVEAWTADAVHWKVGGSNRARSHASVLERLRQGSQVGWVDGPYPSEVLKQKLRGKVVGILEPIYAEPLRIAA